MKYLLALAALLLIATPVYADGCENCAEPSYRPSTNLYQRLDRDDAPLYRAARASREDRAYRAWKREQALERALEAREARDMRRAATARAERRAAQEARSSRLARERRALRDEQARYEGGRRAARNLQYYDEAYNRESGATCKPRVTGYGGNSFTRLGAEASARASWVSTVTDQYSRRYANVKRAEARRYVCDPVSTTRVACKFVARPCRAAEF